jgi:hypothetical protein
VGTGETMGIVVGCGIDMFKLNFFPADLYIPKNRRMYVFEVVVRANRNQVMINRKQVHVNGNKMYFGAAR